jgi:renalase
VTSSPRFAVIGAGLAGLTCAEQLQTTGNTVEVFEKARGPGGRLSSRRRLGTTFDVGAQQLTAQSTAFQQQLKVWQSKGWLASTDQQHWYPLPRMSALTRHLSQPLKLHSATRIVQLQQVNKQWWLSDDQQRQYGPYDQLVLAIPVAQALDLLADHSPSLSQQLQQAGHQPVWMAYFAFETPVHYAPCFPSCSASTLSRWTLQNEKPGQQQALQRWVVEATPDWSQAHVNLPAEQVAERLFAIWCNDAALDIPPQPVLLEAHRWLYGLTQMALQQPWLMDQPAGISICGDFCLGIQAEDAWLSGQALGRQLINPVQ